MLYWTNSFPIAQPAYQFCMEKKFVHKGSSYISYQSKVLTACYTYNSKWLFAIVATWIHKEYRKVFFENFSMNRDCNKRHDKLATETKHKLRACISGGVAIASVETLFEKGVPLISNDWLH